jgi:protein phosphatase
MAVVVGNDVHIANVGDSRAYLISSTGIRQITHDQSFVQMLVDNNVITPEQAVDHPRRNILTQALGTGDEVAAELFSETLGADESILLCSDGLWDMLGDQEIWQIVQVAKTPSQACQSLVDACNAKGARDNIAAVLVRLGA